MQQEFKRLSFSSFTIRMSLDQVLFAFLGPQRENSEESAGVMGQGKARTRASWKQDPSRAHWFSHWMQGRYWEFGAHGTKCAKGLLKRSRILAVHLSSTEETLQYF